MPTALHGPPSPSTTVTDIRIAAASLFHWCFLIYKKEPRLSMIAWEISCRKLVDVSSYHNYGFYGRRTALIHSCAEGHATCVRLLLQANALPNLKDPFGRTALHFAAYNTFPRTNDAAVIISLLLQAGANPEEKDVYNETPLDMAQKCQRRGAVARMLMLNHKGATASNDLQL